MTTKERLSDKETYLVVISWNEAVDACKKSIWKRRTTDKYPSCCRSAMRDTKITLANEIEKLKR